MESQVAIKISVDSDDANSDCYGSQIEFEECGDGQVSILLPGDYRRLKVAKANLERVLRVLTA